MKTTAAVLTTIGILVVVALGVSFKRNSPATQKELVSEPDINQNAQTTENSQIDEGIDGSEFVARLRDRSYEASPISIERTVMQNEAYFGYIFSYMSDGLIIYGRMNVPTGNGPFPVVILNHGYFNQATFTSGDGTQTMADILVRNGYLTLASDYRGFGRSENDDQGSHGHDPDYAIDILNLVESMENLESADPERIGMWGHSMGGEVTLRVAEVTDAVQSIVLWAPTSPIPEENAAFYGGERTSESNPDESHPALNDLYYISAPISLHQGLDDEEVDPRWTTRLHEQLTDLGKRVEYFEYPGQDHNFRSLGWDTISSRTLSFFDETLSSH